MGLRRLSGRNIMTLILPISWCFRLMEISPAIITPTIKQVGRSVVTRNNYMYSLAADPGMHSHLRRAYSSDIAKYGDGPARLGRRKWRRVKIIITRRYLAFNSTIRSPRHARRNRFVIWKILAAPLWSQNFEPPECNDDVCIIPRYTNNA